MNECVSIFLWNTRPRGKDFWADTAIACLMSRAQHGSAKDVTEIEEKLVVRIFYALKCMLGQSWMFLVCISLFVEL